MVKDDFGRTVPLQAHVHSAQLLHRYEERILSDPMLEDMRDAGCLDESYTAVIKAIREGKTKSDVSDMPDDNKCKEYHYVWDRLSVLDDRDSTLLTLDIKIIVVPLSQRKKLLKILHFSHQGITKTYAAAKSRYFWPGLKEEIKKMTTACETCREFNTRLKTNPNIDPETPFTDLQPFKSVGLNIFS